jgi:hypothetical protein
MNRLRSVRRSDDEEDEDLEDRDRMTDGSSTNRAAGRSRAVAAFVGKPT